MRTIELTTILKDDPDLEVVGHILLTRKPLWNGKPLEEALDPNLLADLIDRKYQAKGRYSSIGFYFSTLRLWQEDSLPTVRGLLKTDFMNGTEVTYVGTSESDMVVLQPKFGIRLSSLSPPSDAVEIGELLTQELSSRKAKEL